MEIDKEMLESLFAAAKENPRLRQNFDLRTSVADTSQRMLNALLPSTEVPIHWYPQSSENLICVWSKMGEVLCEEVLPSSLRKVEPYYLCPSEVSYGLSTKERMENMVRMVVRRLRLYLIDMEY